MKGESNLATVKPLRPQLDPPLSPPSSHNWAMSKPALYPETTPSGIAVDPSTLERVIPQSKRPDGTYVPLYSSFTRRDLLIFKTALFCRTRKEIKIKPGFTPQEDITRFRGTKQQEMDTRALPKGHIIGWVAPSSATNNTAGKSSGTMSKSQKKNEKRKEKKKADIAKKIKENWEDDDDDDEDEVKPSSKPKAATESSNKTDSTTDEVAEKLDKLKVDN